MQSWGLLLAAGMFASAPSQAEILQIDFNGTFTSAFSTPAYQNGTAYGGSLKVDTASTASNININPFGTFARFNGAGTFELSLGSDRFSGLVDVLTNDTAAGDDSVRFYFDLKNGYSFGLVYISLAATTVNGAVIPSDPSRLSGVASGSISNAQMRGNFGAANAQAKLVASAVPEISTWSMMILGFAVIGGALRRRKIKATVRFAQKPLAPLA